MFVLFVKDLGRDIYDLYAEYEYEEEEDRFPVSPSHLLLSPTKHLTLNINVGGTVTLLSFYHKHTARLDMLKTRLSHFCCDLTEPDCSSQTHSFTISRLKILHQGELFIVDQFYTCQPAPPVGKKSCSSLGLQMEIMWMSPPTGKERNGYSDFNSTCWQCLVTAGALMTRLTNYQFIKQNYQTMSTSSLQMA